MQRDSIQKYLRIFGIATALVYMMANHAYSQFYVSSSCVDNTAPSTAGGGCYPATSFFDTDLTSTKSVWNFGDPAATISNVDTNRNPRHQYKTAGTYTVTLTKTIGGVIQSSVSKAIVVGTPPTAPLFNKKSKTDTTVCDGKVTLDPYKGQTTPSNVTFLWFPKGETTPTIEVDSSGCYSVEVKTPEGCSKIAQITVKFCLQQSNMPSKKEIWYFGNNGSIEFTKTYKSAPPKDPLANSGTVFGKPPLQDSTSSTTIPKTGNLLKSPQAMAMIYGPDGNVLFYTNGKTILNGENQPIPAIAGLTNKFNGDSSTTQSVLIVPKSACNECPHHQYYVFVQDQTTKMLTYSIIDMRTKDKRGIIVEKNVPVYYPIGERMLGTISNDSTGFFIITHSAIDDKFVISKLDSTGLTVTTQSLGLPNVSPESNQGYVRISPKGDKVAIAVSDGNKNYIEIYKFDRKTGKLAPTPIRVEVPPAPPRVYGIEFSPDGEKLYFTLKGNTNTTGTASRADSSFLYQLNINLPDGIAIAKSAIKIDSSAKNSFGALQLDLDGKVIYMAVNNAMDINGKSILYDIQFPNGTSANKPKQLASIIGYESPPLGGTQIDGSSTWGLPNVIKAKPKNNDDGPSATFTDTCENTTTIFEATPICSPMTNKYVWDFGDGTIKATDSKTVSHKYAKAGKYTIKMTISTYQKVNTGGISISIPGLGQPETHCRDTTLTDVLYIRPSPQTNLPDSIYVCVRGGESKILDATAKGGTGFTYLWKPTNETTPQINVSAIGIFKVHVENAEGCKADTLTKVKNGCEPQVFIPTSFTPNNDPFYESFKVYAKYVTDFELRIFDRWGQQVFYTDTPNPSDKNYYWDGSFQGLIYAPMNYAYVIQYKSEDFPDRPQIIKRGGVLVLQ